MRSDAVALRDIERMTWHRMTTVWLEWLAAGGAPATTLKLRRWQLTRIARDHPRRSPADLTVTDLASWLTRQHWAPETLRSAQSALRSFYDWAQSAGYVTENPARQLRKIPPAPAKPRPAPEGAVTLAVNGASAAGDNRLWMMLMLASRHGLRRGEVARIHTRDVVDGVGGSDLIVHGKGGKNRLVPLLDELADAIRRQSPGWLFPGAAAGQHITPGHVSVLIRRALHGSATAHQLRHRFASRAYQQTHDIRAVQQLLGHASVATTQRYVQVADDALRRAVQSVA